MKITDYRDTQGRYKKKNKFKIILNWIILILIVIALYSINSSFKKTNISEPAATTVQTQTDSGVQSVMNEADFQAQMKLQAQTIELTRERDAENIRHTQAITTIETQLEQVRAQQLKTPSLQ